MAQNSIEDRVTVLEQQMLQIRAKLENGQPAKGWRETVGMFSGDEGMKRIDEAARRYREADRAKARKQRRRKGVKC